MEKTKIKRNYEAHCNCGAYYRSLYWNCSWDKRSIMTNFI